MTNGDAPWRDKELLRQKYCQEGLSTTEIAEEWDCGSSTIGEWLHRHGIQTRDRGGKDRNKPYKDEDTLRYLYHKRGMTMEEMAEKYDVAYSTINNAMKKAGVESRRGREPYHRKEWLKEQYLEKGMTASEIAELRDTHEQTIFYHLRKHGIERDYRQRTAREGQTPEYSYIHHRENGQNHYILVHRLVAYAHGILNDLFESDKHIHHKNGVHWINSPENLECLTNKEHQELHSEQDVEGEFIQNR